MNYNFKDEDIINLLIQGKSCTEIGKIFNINYQKVQRRARKLVLPDNVYIKRRPKNIVLTQEELDVLIGGLLGDTWLGYTKLGVNACGSFTHKLEHKNYVQYKYEKLKRLCSKPSIHNKNDRRSNRIYQQSFCKIGTNPILNDIVDKFYKDGRKTIYEDLLYRLSPLAIAIWYMDDGSKSRYGYKISTNCFNTRELDILRKWLQKYNLKITVTVENELYIKAESRDTFTKLIKDFFPNCMRYKLHNLLS